MRGTNRVIELLRRCQFGGAEAIEAWMGAENPDLDGLSPNQAITMNHHAAVIRALEAEVGRREAERAQS